MNIKKINEQLEGFMEDYDTWLYQQADEYNDPHTVEITIKGHSYFKVKAKNTNGEIVELDNIPLEVYQVIDTVDEDEEYGTHIPRWHEIEDDIEDRYFDLANLDSFNTYVEDIPEEELLPEGYTLEEILGFAEGHSFEDLEIE